MKAPNIVSKETALHVGRYAVVWGGGWVFVEKLRCQEQPCFWSSYCFTSIGSSSRVCIFNRCVEQSCQPKKSYLRAIERNENSEKVKLIFNMVLQYCPLLLTLNEARDHLDIMSLPFPTFWISVAMIGFYSNLHDSEN